MRGSVTWTCAQQGTGLWRHIGHRSGDLKLRDLGAEVVAVSRDPSKAGQIDGVTLRGCDVRDREGLEQLFAECAPFDILISAATGGERAAGPFMQMDLDGYQASFDKLWGYANVVRLGGEHLSETGIVLVDSPAHAKPGQATALLARRERLVRAVAGESTSIDGFKGVISTPMFGDDAEARDKMLAGATAKHLIARPGTAGWPMASSWCRMISLPVPPST